jgi:hypothetical protein
LAQVSGIDRRCGGGIGFTAEQIRRRVISTFGAIYTLSMTVAMTVVQNENMIS